MIILHVAAVNESNPDNPHMDTAEFHECDAEGRQNWSMYKEAEAKFREFVKSGSRFVTITTEDIHGSGSEFSAYMTHGTP